MCSLICSLIFIVLSDFFSSFIYDDNVYVYVYGQSLHVWKYNLCAGVVGDSLFSGVSTL